MRQRLALGCSLFGALLLGCSGSTPSTGSTSGSGGAGGGSAAGGAGGGAAFCEAAAGATSHTIVSAIVPSGGEAYVTSFTIEGGGRIVAHPDAHVPVQGPQEIALSPDGKTALVAYGLFSGDYGVLVLDVGPGGTGLALRQNLKLGSGMLASDVAWASNDHAAVATEGGTDGHVIVGLDRDANGMFTASKAAAIEGNWPIGLARLPGASDAAGDVVLLRGDLTASPDETELRHLARGPSGWLPLGKTAKVTPAAVRFAVFPKGTMIYAPSEDPVVRASADELAPPGALHLVRVAGDDLVPEPTFTLPHVGTIVTIAPSGGYLVTQQPVFSVGGQSVTVASYLFQTVSLDAMGKPTEARSSAKGFTAANIEAMQLVGDDLLVLGLTVAAEKASETHPIVVLRQSSPGNWEEACDRFFAPGLPVLTAR